MGFSLDMFFDELLEVINSNKRPFKKVWLLTKIIRDGHAYAKECGQLKNDKP